MNSELEQLKSRNAEDGSALRKPYQSVVYAIPKEQWEAMLRLLTGNLSTLPGITEAVGTLATEGDLAEYIDRILTDERDSARKVRMEMQAMAADLRAQMTNLSSQVGSYREQNSKDQAALTDSLQSQYKQMTSKLWKRLAVWLVCQTALLAGLFVLLRIWLG